MQLVVADRTRDTRMFRNIFVILLGLLCSVKITNSKGTLELQFVKYENPGGEGSNGNCCDGMSFFCGSACDHNFDICVDVQSGPRDMNVCPYGRKSSGEISNQDTIIFGNKGGVKMKINIHDKDNNNDDHVDYLEKHYTAHPKIYSEANNAWVQFNIKARTSLTAKIRVYCDMYYYNANCDTLCKPGNSESEGFYTCDPKTGSKICKEGQFCNETVSPECTNITCHNGGNCSVINGSISCKCQSGWTGNNCESKYDPCDAHVCYNNGTCNSTDDVTATCFCEEGWSGGNCETEINPCDMCMSNSTCISGNGTENVTCLCLVGWTGNNCETKYSPCDSDPCWNNGTCTNNGTMFECSCAANFSGINCEINETAIIPPTTTTQVTTTSDSKTPSVVFTFVGLVKDDEQLRKEFQHLIYDLTGEKDGIKILYKKEYPSTVKGKPLTKVSFKVLNAQGKNINDKLNTVLSETRHEDLDKYFTLPLYHEEPIKPTKVEGHTGWIHTYWFVILISLLVFIILLVVLGCMVARVKRRKMSQRKQKEFLARQSSNVSDALPAQSFENSLYFEMNQPIKKDQQAGATWKIIGNATISYKLWIEPEEMKHNRTYNSIYCYIDDTVCYPKTCIFYLFVNFKETSNTKACRKFCNYVHSCHKMRLALNISLNHFYHLLLHKRLLTVLYEN
ncbi:hypothetical protein KUTeg_020508, partial [Tegillarca granosa]